MENASNITNRSIDTDVSWDNIEKEVTWFMVFQFIFIVAGAFLNLWLVSSILTSKDLRVRLRNQLISNLSISYVLQCLVMMPTQAALLWPFIHYDRNIHTLEYFCKALSVDSIVGYTSNFLINWLMVFLLVTVLAQLVNFNPENKLTPQAVRICTVALHVIPWVVVAIATPVAITALTRRQFCVYVPLRYMHVFESVYTIIPLGVSILLSGLAVALRFRRFTHGSGTSGGNMGTQLIGRGPEIDNTLAYVAAAVICAGCEVCTLISSFEYANRIYRGMRFELLSYFLSDSRVVLMLIPWLLLPDIRQRIRSWRPWKPEPTGTDIAMAYRRDSESS